MISQSEGQRTMWTRMQNTGNWSIHQKFSMRLFRSNIEDTALLKPSQEVARLLLSSRAALTSYTSKQGPASQTTPQRGPRTLARTLPSLVVVGSCPASARRFHAFLLAQETKMKPRRKEQKGKSTTTFASWNLACHRATHSPTQASKHKITVARPANRQGQSPGMVSFCQGNLSILDASQKHTRQKK